ncbi:MAG TPA: phosphoribosyltransferase [Trueperaceae bacterium]|nr:phosphoribosyltransferase [Trueperaceae bacterium]
MTARAHFTEPTTDYWQRFTAADALPEGWQAGEGPWRFGYPAVLPDGRVLMLPIRQLASDPAVAVASLIGNQASLAVSEALGVMLAGLLAMTAPEVIVGMPTLGLGFAPIVARELGLERLVPLGYSRKFWYDDALSAPVRSLTTPDGGKRVYLDPNLLPLLRGRRVVLVDDVVSSGATLDAPWRLIESLGAEVVACGVVMRQGERWNGALGPDRAAKVVSVLDTPLLQAVPEGWVRR